MKAVPLRQVTRIGLLGGMTAVSAYLAYAGVTWLRYGHPCQARPDERDALLDRFMPVYDVVERQHIAVDAPAAVTLDVARTLCLNTIPLVRTIFRTRELLLGSEPGGDDLPAGLIDQMHALGWGVLAEEPGSEIVLGAVTRPWEPNPTFQAVDPATVCAVRCARPRQDHLDAACRSDRAVCVRLQDRDTRVADGPLRQRQVPYLLGVPLARHPSDPPRNPRADQAHGRTPVRGEHGMNTSRSHGIVEATPRGSLAGAPLAGARGATASPSAWHAEPAHDVLSRLGSAASGLTDIEATRRLGQFGPNQLARVPPKPALAILWSQFQSIVVVLLIVAILVAAASGEYANAIAVAVVLVINTGIGFATELRARRAMDALLQFDVPRAAVIRDGMLRGVPAHVLVVGDVIELNPGQHVPADARLLETSDLRTSEATLTGESVPVSKHAHAELPQDTPVADRVTMVYKGTTVAAGIARAVITATGASTEVGRIGTLVAGLREERTPLEGQLDALGRRLVWLAVGVAAAVSALNAWHGASLAVVIETGLALAVAAVPEALPAVATIALAIGVRRMARRHALVRRLPAVEALGSTTVVCTDKTRTLTSGDMSVVHVWAAGADFDLAPEALGRDDVRLRVALETAALASRAQAAGPMATDTRATPSTSRF